MNDNLNKLADDVRFELTEPLDPTVFKTAALNHSANRPYQSIDIL